MIYVKQSRLGIARYIEEQKRERTGRTERKYKVVVVVVVGDGGSLKAGSPRE